MKAKLLIILTIFAPFYVFAESIKISFHHKWSPKYEGLNQSIVRIVSSQPMIYGSKKDDGTSDRHVIGLSFTELAKHWNNSLRASNPITKQSLSTLKAILADLIGLKTVNLGDEFLFTLETLSMDIETLFIKNDYSVTCKTIERKDEANLKEIDISIYFKKD